MKIKYLVITLVLISLTSFIIGGGFLAVELNQKKEMNIKTIEEIKEIGGDFDTIDVDFYSDNIKIISTNNNLVKVTLTGTIESSNDKTELNLEVEQESNNLNIRKNIKNFDEKLVLFDFNNLYNEDVNILIEIPKEKLYDLKLDSSSSDRIIRGVDFNKIIVSGYSGSTLIESSNFDSLECYSSSGEISLKSVKVEEILCETYSGDLDFEDIKSDNTDVSLTSGELKIKNSKIRELNSISYSGDVDLSDNNIKRTKIETTSGEVKIETNQSGDLSISTYSGDIDLEIDEGSEFTLKFETYSGDLSNDFPIKIKENYRENLIGIVGNGKDEFNIKTSSGDLTISN